MHVQTPRLTNGSIRRSLQSRRERVFDRSVVVHKTKDVLPRSQSAGGNVPAPSEIILTLVPNVSAVDGTFLEPLNIILTLVLNVSVDRQGGPAEPASPRLPIDVAVPSTQNPGALVSGRARGERHPRVYRGTPCSPVEVAEARLPSNERYVDESEGCPIQVPTPAGGGLSSVLCRGRR